MNNYQIQISKWIHHSGDFKLYKSGAPLNRIKEYKNLNRKCFISGLTLLGYDDNAIKINIKMNVDKFKDSKKFYKQLCDTFQVPIDFIDMDMGSLYINNIKDPNIIHFVLNELEKFDKILPNEIKNDICETFGAKTYLTFEKFSEIINTCTDLYQILISFNEIYNKYPDLIYILLNRIHNLLDYNFLLKININNLIDIHKILILNEIIKLVIDKKINLNMIGLVLKNLINCENLEVINLRNKLIGYYIADNENLNFENDENLIITLLEFCKTNYYNPVIKI